MCKFLFPDLCVALEMSELIDKVKFFLCLCKPSCSKTSLLENMNGSDGCNGHGFKSKKCPKKSPIHNIPSSIVVLDEKEKLRLRYTLVQMNLRENELLF